MIQINKKGQINKTIIVILQIAFIVIAVYLILKALKIL